MDYYLATKACLQWECFPAGGSTSFESASVQKLFYQNIVKRLESELFESWGLRSENLDSLGSRENELYWGMIGREVVRRDTSRPKAPARGDEKSAFPSHPVSNMTSQSYSLDNPTLLLPMRTQYGRGFQNQSLVAASPTQSLYLFDASHHEVPEQE